MNDNMKRLVNQARTLSKLRSGEEEDYEEEWAGIGRMVSAKPLSLDSMLVVQHRKDHVISHVIQSPAPRLYWG